MTKKIECPRCAGMGKRLVKKGGRVKAVTCRDCKGKGKIAEKSAAKSQAKDLPVGARLETVHDKPVKLSKLTTEQHDAKETIEERSAFFGCPGKVKAVVKGPIITLYEFAPAKVTRIKRLQNLQEDLALALSAEAVMVRRVPGKDVIGIEISNAEGDRQNVGFRASLAQVRAAKQSGMELPLNLGTDPFGQPIVDDLATMPHLLIAGSTGAGKSVSLNCIISSLLTVCSPQELQFFMIDPKGVELTHYDGIPHMLEPMVKSPHYAKHMLESLIREMRERMTLLARRAVRDIKEYNRLARLPGNTDADFRPLPRIVLVVDELGDLMMQDRREFTRMFAEISQIARASGIHMIVATQRPSVDVLSGKIKVNFPGRMAFKVTSGTDSRTIVHKKGAEGLLGRGDMLYLSPTRSSVIRIHAPWVPLEDVIELAGKIRKIEEDRKAAEAERLRKEALARDAAATERRIPQMAPVPGEADLPLDLSWARPHTEARDAGVRSVREVREAAAARRHNPRGTKFDN